MELHTKRLMLREFCQNDLTEMLEYECNPKTSHFEKGPPREEAVRQRLSDAIRWSQEQPRTHYLLAVTIPPDNCARGRISLTLNISEIREWEIGWAIHPRFWDRGYATEAAISVVNFAFQELQAHRVVAFCHVLNAASTRVMQKIGMQQDGYLRETRWWNEGWCDELVYSILEREWSFIKQ
jgi:[ribosomal protein S5]-alanine N-acetyltransferase